MNALDMVTRKFKLICEWDEWDVHTEDVVQLDRESRISENLVRASKGELRQSIKRRNGPFHVLCHTQSESPSTFPLLKINVL